MSADLATLSIKVDSSGVVSASRNLEALTARSRNTETATQSMTKTFERVTTSMKVSSGSILTASKDFEQLSGKSRAVEAAIVSMTKSYEKVTTSMKDSSSSISTATRDFETFTEASGKSEKAASAMSGRFGKIKSACAGFMSTVGKAYDYAQQAMELMEEGAKASRIETSFKLMSDAAGFSSEKIISSMKEATQGTISSSDMMQKATSLMLQGYNPEQIERFSKVVVTASQYAGTTAAEAYDQLADAIGKRNPEALLRLGAITTDQMDVVSKAIKNGVSSSEIFELAMANLELRTAQLKGTQDKEVIALQQFHAQLSETKEQTGQFITAVLQRFYALFQYISAGSLIISSDIYKMIQGIQILISHLPGTDKGKWQESAKSWGAAAENDFNEAMKLIKQANNNVWNTAETVTRTTQREIAKKSQAVDKEFNDIKRNINTARNNNSQSTSGKASKGSLTKTTFDMEAYDRAMGQYKQITAEANAAVTDDFTKANLQIIEQWREREAKLTALLDDGRISWEQYEAAITAIDAAASAEMNKNLQRQIEDRANFYSQIQGYEEQYRNLKLEWINREQEVLAKKYNDEVAAAQWAAREKIKLEQDVIENIKRRFDEENKYKKEAIENAKAIFDNAIALYDEDSKEYKRLYDLKKVLIGLELAQEIEKNAKIVLSYLTKAAAAEFVAATENAASDAVITGYEGETIAAVTSAETQNAANASTAVSGAVSSTAAQGSVPGAGFGMVAAMAAVMAGILGIIGIGFNPGTSSGAGSTKKSTSTALGSEEPSESVSKSYELLKNTYDMQNSRLTALYNEMKDMNNNITGLVTNILKTGGISTSGFGNLHLGTAGTKQDTLWTGFYQFTNKYLFSAIEKFGDWTGKALGDLGASIFGGRVNRKITQSGLSIGSSSVADILSGGVDAQEYAKIKTTKEGGWFGSDKTSYSFAYKELDASVSNGLDKVYQNLGNTLVNLSEALGLDTSKAFAYVFEETKLNLKGMTAEEMTTAINEYFSTLSDNAAEALFGEVITKYQKVNEGLLETAVRLVQDKEVVLDYMEKVNKAFVGTTENAIAFSEALISAAGDLDTLTGAVNTYYDKFFSESDKQKNRTRELTEALAAYGYPLPATRDAFKALVQSIDAAADPQKYYDIIKLSGTFDELFSYLEEEAETLKETLQTALDTAKTNLEAAFSAEKERINDLYNKQLEKFQDNLSAITETVNKLRSARESMNLVDKQTDEITFLRSKQALMKGVYNDDILKSVTSISPEQYSTREAYLKDYHKIYNKLYGLEKEATAKQTDAQKQIDILTKTHDDQIAALDKQYNALVGIDDSVMSVADAIVAYHQAYAKVNNVTYVKGPNCPTYAEGGSASGWGIAGEAGTELINFGTSSRVYSNSESRKLFDTKALESKFDVLTNQIKTDNVKIKAELAAMRLDLDRQEALGPKPTRTSL